MRLLSVSLTALSLAAICPAAHAQTAPGPKVRQPGLSKLDQVSLRIDIFDVEISQDGRQLWQGTIRSNRMVTANQSIDVREPADLPCLPRHLTPSNEYHLEFRVMKYGGNLTDPDTYEFAATLERSDLAPDCQSMIKSSDGTSRTMRMRRGQSVELQGDHGLLVRIRRRI